MRKKETYKPQNTSITSGRHHHHHQKKKKKKKKKKTRIRDNKNMTTRRLLILPLMVLLSALMTWCVFLSRVWCERVCSLKSKHKTQKIKNPKPFFLSRVQKTTLFFFSPKARALFFSLHIIAKEHH